MTIHDWSEIATIAQGVTALIAAILIYRQIKSAHKDNLQQIEEQREENRKWKTLDICSQYEFSDTVSCAASKVQVAFDSGEITDEIYTRIYRDAKVVLNYLDGIAIGVDQGLYIEALARGSSKTNR